MLLVISSNHAFGLNDFPQMTEKRISGLVRLATEGVVAHVHVEFVVFGEIGITSNNQIKFNNNKK